MKELYTFRTYLNEAAGNHISDNEYKGIKYSIWSNLRGYYAETEEDYSSIIPKHSLKDVEEVHSYAQSNIDNFIQTTNKDLDETSENINPIS